MSLTAETKNWMVDYGLYCNRKYRSDMEQIFAFVDEAGKKLNRQIKDLDDIRIAMASLKEIREHQISIDFQVAPIEVNTALGFSYSMVVADLLHINTNAHNGNRPHVFNGALESISAVACFRSV